jgi:hypothetical protein
MREIHSLEHIEKKIKERAKTKFGDGVEIIERAHAAKKNGRHLRIVMQRFGQIAPLLSKSMDSGLAALLSLFPNLRGEIYQRRDSNEHRR